MNSVSTRPQTLNRDLWSLGVLPVLAIGTFAGLLGVYWDISWHIDIGRDTFFTLPHNFLYAGIAAVLMTSLYGLWRDRRETPFHLRWGNLRLHAGVLTVAVGAALVLMFAPMDELWHRLFGTDVTLWAPMHLIGLLGLLLGSFGGLVSAWIERRLAGPASQKQLYSSLGLFFATALLGWMNLLLAEYEFNVPQFPSVLHPILLMGLPSFVLVLISQLNPRPWAATTTALIFTAMRLLFSGGLIWTASQDLAGYSRPMIPILIITALVVDFLIQRKLATWAIGLIAGAVTLLSNLPLVRLTDGMVWHNDVVLAAVVPGLVLSVLAGWAGAATASALKGRNHKEVQA